jgi:hypothetical protein
MSDTYQQTDSAPNFQLGADGKTVLTRYRMVGVVYAPSREEAQRRIDLAAIYLARARLEPAN